MLQKLRFKQDFRCFKSGEIIEFRPGVNLIVGDQGTGKSTLFQVIRTSAAGVGKCIADVGIIASEGTRLVSYDFEKENPRTQDMRTRSRPFTFNLAARFHSHGQVVNRLLAETDDLTGTLLMDEPDMALSVRSIAALVARFRKSAQAGNQIIAAVHNPLLIGGFDAVYSVEHRQWMNSNDFVAELWQSGTAE